MNPIGGIILLVLIGVVVGGSRRHALLAMLAGILYLTQGVQIQVGGVSMFATRFLCVAGILRIAARGELSLGVWTGIDRAFFILHGYTTAVFLLRSDDGQMFQVGLAVDAVLSYLIFRSLLRDFDDLRWLIRTSLLLLVPFFLVLVVERVARHNMFTIIGAREVTDNFSRGDRPRCFGTFGHPSLLGTLGASFLPLFVALRMVGNRREATVGIFISLGVVFMSNSGGPLNAMAFGILGWCCWKWREGMRNLRWMLVISIAVIASIMESPIYYLPARLSSFTGGDGWHRSYLIEQFFGHWTEWILGGMPIRATASWFPYVIEGTGGADITNQFVKYGIDGGIGSMVLFTWLLKVTFSSIGEGLIRLRISPLPDLGAERLMWSIGVVIVVHLATWFGITYFDQTSLLWHLHLAAASTLSMVCIGGGAQSEGVAADGARIPAMVAD